MDRSELLETIVTSRSRLERVLARSLAARACQPELPGGWSVKDLLAHLGWWEQHAAKIYHALEAGHTPEGVPPSELDPVNAQVIESFRDHSLEEVRTFERQAYRNLLHIAETAPEEDLFDPHRFAWTEGGLFVDIIIWNSSDHYDEHRVALERVMGSGEILQRAGAFIQRSGREVEKALFDFHFGSGDREELLSVLAQYQNEDGGFHTLEVDIKAPQSNPFATELALNIMRWSYIPADDPLLARTIAYLEDIQQDDGTWRFSPEIYEHSLAPWFQHWQWPNLNPSCTIAGLLKELGAGSSRLHARVKDLFQRIATPTDLVSNEYYNLRPYAYYFQVEWEMPQEEFYRWGVVWWLLRQHATSTGIDATHFMDFAPAPHLEIARRVPDNVLAAKLDALINEQAEDGGWPTPYDPQWRGWNTIMNLLVLRAYCRL